MKIKSQKDFFAGLMFMCVGVAFAWGATTYNVGTGALQASTLRRRINAGDWPGAQVEMLKWCFAGGRRLPGLVTRRAIEAGMLA